MAAAAPAAGSPSPVPLPPSLVAYADGDRTDAQWSLAATHAAAAWRALDRPGRHASPSSTPGVDATSPDLAGAVVEPAHLEPATGRIVGRARAPTWRATAPTSRGSSPPAPTGTASPASRRQPASCRSTSSPTPTSAGAQIGAAIRWAVASGARVVNLSLGEPDLEVAAADVAPVCAAVGDAVAAGVVVVAAAGNDGDGTNFREAPASCPGAIAVSAVTSALTPSVWSSFDGTVAVAAPG